MTEMGRHCSATQPHFTHPELAWLLVPILRELQTVRQLVNFQVLAKETGSLSPCVRFVLG